MGRTADDEGEDGVDAWEMDGGRENVGRWRNMDEDVRKRISDLAILPFSRKSYRGFKQGSPISSSSFSSCSYSYSSALESVFVR